MAASDPEYWSDSRACGGPELEDGTVTGVDMVNDQLRGSVDPSGTPLHGCAEYQEEALLAENLPGAGALVCSDQFITTTIPGLE